MAEAEFVMVYDRLATESSYFLDLQGASMGDTVLKFEPGRPCKAMVSNRVNIFIALVSQRKTLSDSLELECGSDRVHASILYWESIWLGQEISKSHD